ncbi:Membrane-bound lytic murein transglycosylase F [Austwickia sp. TVS 96-490-7B]|uniref:transglycosylase SLT domain-containing protein n=1 Tax=Austwickia sp. TVS 96-490-7B TaxID=2830843 RepID=UPI001C55E787|nr:transglycosylase SLT domain-containing protein [Austwickia sp. TVS 96-490-7B]MBW3083931.1 Membrane-bound lytic murein transglycosylase F [Austwickia sp. TVS 96-490-7B]
MSVELSGFAACQARIADIQAKFFGNGVTQPGTYTADGALNGRTAWNYKLQDLKSLYDTAAVTGGKFPWSGVDVSPYNTNGTGNGIGGTFTSGNTRPTSSATAVSGALAMTGASGNDVVAAAKKYLGVPYVWGGTSSSGLDCSGLVQKAYGDLGITLPRVAADQARMGTSVPSLSHAKPGDLLAFGSPVDHIAIYVGGGKMIAAPQPGENVKIQSVYTTPTAIRRVVSDAPAAAPYAALTSNALAAPSGPTGSALAAAPASYRALFQAAQAKYGVPAALLAAVAKAESGFNAGVVSPAGAIGLMQIMPSTARSLGVDPRNPAQAVDGAARLLRDGLNQFRTTALALAAYNAGPGAVKQYGGVPPYPETQNYVRKIMADPGVRA